MSCNFFLKFPPPEKNLGSKAGNNKTGQKYENINILNNIAMHLGRVRYDITILHGNNIPLRGTNVT